MNRNIKNKIAAYKKRFPSVKNLIISESMLPDKRLTASFDIGGEHKIVNFGLRGAYTYADGAPEQKRDSYRARASKIRNKSGRSTYMIPGTANSFAYWLLW